MVIGLICASIIAWFISTLAGGGSSLVLIPIVGFFLTTSAIPSIITVGSIFGNAERAIAYRTKINWKIIYWELPAALVGCCLGALVLTQINLEWLTLLIAIFLLISGINYLIKPKTKTFEVKAWYFLPLGFLYAFLSGIIGSTVPFLVPFYLNYGLEKEELLGTQAINRTAIHVIKVVAYYYLGILTLPYLYYGIIIGLASFPGNWLGDHVLQKISEKHFRQLVMFYAIIISTYMLWQQRNMLIFF